jgi:transposase
MPIFAIPKWVALLPRVCFYYGMNDSPLSADLQCVQAAISATEWARRVAEASEQAATLDRVLQRMTEGMSELAALRAVVPGAPVSTWRRRLTRYRSFGPQGLIDRRFPRAPPPRQVTSEVQGFVRGLLRAKPELRAPQVQAEVTLALGVQLQGSTVRKLLQELGLSHHVGRPAPVPRPEPLPLAGAELLKAVDLELGAVATLTRDIAAAMVVLLPPLADDGVREDTANRDGEGRFLPAYNEPKPRTAPELGERFDSVRTRSVGKDLPAMRTANSSIGTLFRKVLALTMLPCVTDAPRWSALRHWQGDWLEGLVGYAYQPATLDKFARELKYAGVAAAARESVARLWIGAEAKVSDPAVAAVVLYGDARVKPLWTHHYSRCTAVTRLGKRVMPAITTIHLHSGCGTPLIYREFSGGASVPREIGAMLKEYETDAGESTVRRLVVLDSESHAVWLFKELDKLNYLFLIPLRSSSTGASARFEEVSPWLPYRKDEVCSGWLWVNDSRPREPAIRIRVVARRRHRTGSVAWYATNAPASDFGDAKLIDLYFARWPLQEHVFRDGNGRVGLGAHHGYGKEQIGNVAVLDEMDRIDVALAKALGSRRALAEAAEAVACRLGEQEATIAMYDAELAALGARVEAGWQRGHADPHAMRRQELVEGLRASRGKAEEHRAALADQLVKNQCPGAKVQAREAELTARRVQIAAHQTIFTVDTELDEIITAFKLTFMCLCKQLMKRYLGTSVEIDTLIRGVLTLPGERVLTRGVETIRIFRQARERELMPRVEEACRLLTARALRRDKRVLRFEVVDGPER